MPNIYLIWLFLRFSDWNCRTSTVLTVWYVLGFIMYFPDYSSTSEIMPLTATYTDVMPTQTSSSETSYLQSSFYVSETNIVSVGKISTIKNTNEITSSMYSTMVIFQTEPELATSTMKTVSAAMLYTTGTETTVFVEPELIFQIWLHYNQKFQYLLQNPKWVQYTICQNRNQKVQPITQTL